MSQFPPPPPSPPPTSSLPLPPRTLLPPPCLSRTMGWGDGDGHHHALQSLDWDSIMKDLDLHDDVSAPAPLNPPESTHFVNNSSDVATLSDIYGSCHQSFAHVPTSNYGSFELGGEVCNNWGFAFDFLEELI
ncbi:hypothetical protein CDL15_Pgr014414 [Punica granatum]|uniref:Uncharacterized protein n=1 Tax=Punica granatum TaxID=22663 RepID=A0A218WEV3_PUNGR|nr:hypothetical protein CDL15_Pgr014414 [Punica granatum]